MEHQDTPDDQPSAAADGADQGLVAPIEERTGDVTAPVSRRSDDTPTQMYQPEPEMAASLPRHVRRRAAREKAKRQKRSHRNPPQSAYSDDGPLAPEELSDDLLDQAAAKYRKYRKSQKDQQFTSPDAVLNPGLVIIRGEGEEHDDRVAFSVHARLFRWCSAHKEIAVCILDGIVYDALPIVFREPFQELRASALTGASASDEVFGITAAFYANAHATVSRTWPFLAAEHGHDLLQRIREAEGADAWKYTADTPPLSTLAQRVLLYVLHCVHYASTDGTGTLGDVRHLIAHGRLLELIDPRDGPR